MDSETPTDSPEIIDYPQTRALFDWWRLASGGRTMP
jgi:hypothetical protein